MFIVFSSHIALAAKGDLLELPHGVHRLHDLQIVIPAYFMKGLMSQVAEDPIAIEILMAERDITIPENSESFLQLSAGFSPNGKGFIPIPV